MEISEEELKAHVSKDVLHKLTVPMLKEASKVYGLKGRMRKQELLDMLTKHFQHCTPSHLSTLSPGCLVLFSS